jgi:hypothetical protein
MNLKQSTILALEISVDHQLDNKDYDNALRTIAKYRLRGYTITKSRAKSEYNMKDCDFRALSCSLVDNPYFKSAPKMRLYLKREIKDKYSKSAIRNKKINELLTI